MIRLALIPVYHEAHGRVYARTWAAAILDPETGDVTQYCEHRYGHKTRETGTKCARKLWISAGRPEVLKARTANAQ